MMHERVKVLLTNQQHSLSLKPFQDFLRRIP